MTETRQPRLIQGDPAEANRGLGQEIVGEAWPGPRQRPLDPAAGGPGSGAGERESARRPGNAPRTEKDRAIRDDGLPQNSPGHSPPGPDQD